MQWSDLSNEAKAIIEWMENPYTNEKETVEIKIGEIFHRNCPKLCGNFTDDESKCDILVTKELFQEVLTYVIEDKNILYEQFDDSLLFWLKLDINDIKSGMVLLNKTRNKKYVVIETLLNGDDDYYSSLRIITEDEYIENIGKCISEDKLKTSEWIEMSEYYSDYENCEERYNVNIKKDFRF